MPEQSRRRCVFCAQPAGSQEHALPAWLAKTMKVESEPSQPGQISAARGVEPQGNPRATGKLITKGVCQNCNNGWMADLEGAVRPILAPLVTPDLASFRGEALEPLAQNLPLLTRWLMKTAVTLSMVAPRGDLGSLPEEAAEWAYHDAVPTSCMLYAGWIEDAHFSKMLGRGLRILNGGVFHGNQIHETSFDFRLQLNHLGLRFVNAPDATWALTSCRNSAGEPCSPQILIPTGYFDAATNESVLFRNFFEFSKVCVLATGTLPDQLDPEEDRKMSESIRRLIP
jgi:hypothetical protein